MATTELIFIKPMEQPGGVTLGFALYLIFSGGTLFVTPAKVNHSHVHTAFSVIN